MMYTVRLTTMAYMRGQIEIEATSQEEAERLALERTGDVEWEYDGMAEGPDQGPEVSDVQPHDDRITLVDLDTGDRVRWTMAEILEEINRDRSSDWCAYDETDWQEGLREWTRWRQARG